MTNQRNTLLYVGVTNGLKRRVFVHKEKLADGFTKKYERHKRVYYELCDAPQSAIAREKQLKAGSRKKKLSLINAANPTWKDLYDDF